jgi:hypothetical protein
MIVILPWAARIFRRSINDTNLKPCSWYVSVKCLEFNSFSIVQDLNIIWMPVYCVKMEGSIIWESRWSNQLSCYTCVGTIWIKYEISRRRDRGMKPLSFNLRRISSENINLLPWISGMTVSQTNEIESILFKECTCKVKLSIFETRSCA